MDGGCVRLQQGDAARKTQYGVSPEMVASSYESNGARRIHVVDLDGAFGGTPKNLDAIRAIRGATSAEIEVGGGIRDRKTIETLLSIGINYVIIGTKALEQPEFLAEIMPEFGPKVIIGADSRNGFLSTRGWTSDTKLKTVPFLRSLKKEHGVHTVVFTDIARDGMFTSPNYEALDKVLAMKGMNVIASGGVGEIGHIERLIEIKSKRDNLLGVIVGKAIYDGRLSLREAIQLARAATTPA